MNLNTPTNSSGSTKTLILSIGRSTAATSKKVWRRQERTWSNPKKFSFQQLLPAVIKQHQWSCKPFKGTHQSQPTPKRILKQSRKIKKRRSLNKRRSISSGSIRSCRKSGLPSSLRKLLRSSHRSLSSQPKNSHSSSSSQPKNSHSSFSSRLMISFSSLISLPIPMKKSRNNPNNSRQAAITIMTTTVLRPNNSIQ